MAPMTRMYSPGGVPGDDVARYYARRAAGGVGLIITEGSYIPHPAVGPSRRVPHLWGDEAAAGWAGVVEAVHAGGAKIFSQLWHLGSARGDQPKYRPEQLSVGPSGITPSGDRSGVALTVADIEFLIECYAHAAEFARAVGFDGVEIHGAHGYLIDQFFWSRTNRRTDDYGRPGVFAERVVRAVRRVVGPDFPIVFRYSQWKTGDYDARIAETPDHLAALLGALVDAGVDALHPSTRRFWSPGFPDHDPQLSLAGWTRKLTGLPTIAVGSVGLDRVFAAAGVGVDAAEVTGIDELLTRFEQGEFDLVAVGRALLADADWVAKHAAGRVSQIQAYDPSHMLRLT
nr:12-oxophytodienoate reductase [Skermania piniformis]